MASYDHVLFENTDMVMRTINLRNKVTGVLVESATVSARVLDSAGDAVANVSDPVVFVEQSGFKGLYHGALPDTATLANGDTGTIVYTSEAGAGLHREWTETYVVRQTAS